MKDTLITIAGAAVGAVLAIYVGSAVFNATESAEATSTPTLGSAPLSNAFLNGRSSGTFTGSRTMICNEPVRTLDNCAASGTYISDDINAEQITIQQYLVGASALPPVTAFQNLACDPDGNAVCTMGSTTIPLQQCANIIIPTGC
jgi:hypothetical protein